MLKTWKCWGKKWIMNSSNLRMEIVWELEVDCMSVWELEKPVCLGENGSNLCVWVKMKVVYESEWV